MEHLTLENIADACGGRYIGDEGQKKKEITGVVIDSREVAPGNLFIAVKGARSDGHTFIPEVFDKGAFAVLSEQELIDPKGPYILVGSTLEAMKDIAAFYRQSLDIKVVGITGSVGKTSTKEMIASVLSQKYDVLKTAGNFNNEIGLPLTVFRIRSHHRIAVLEMGISDFGEMQRLAKIANPDICVVTNIGLCHLENLGSRDGILQEKTRCFDYMKEDGTAVLNGDDDKLRTKRVVNDKASVFYGIIGNGGEVPEVELQVYADHVENLGFDGTQALIHTPQGDFEVRIPIPGEHNIYNALAAAAVGLQLGLTIEEIAKGIASAQALAGRNNLLKIKGMTVIDDCYNANPVSMKASIEVLSHAKGRSIAVLGDMGELGNDEKELHYEVGRSVGSQKITTLFCSGTLAKEYARGAEEANPKGEVYWYPDRKSMTEALLTYIKPEDTVLVKASHFMEFPKVIEALQGLEKMETF